MSKNINFNLIFEQTSHLSQTVFVVTFTEHYTLSISDDKICLLSHGEMQLKPLIDFPIASLHG